MIDDKKLKMEQRAAQLWDQGKLKQAFQLYRKLARQGYDCDLNLGVMYSEGTGVKKSDRWALYWYHKALATTPPCAAAANNIGIVYRDQGNKALALQWFKKSVELGNGDANLELAYLHLRKPLLNLEIAKQYLQQTINAELVTEWSREVAARLLDWLNEPHEAANNCRPCGSRLHCQQARLSLLTKHQPQLLSGSPLPTGERG